MVDAWQNTVKSQLKPLVRALYSAGEFVGEADGVASFSVPNEAHGAKCAEHQSDVEAALSAAVGAPVTIRFVAGGNAISGGGGNGGSAPATKPAPAPAPEPAPEPAEPRESALERATRAAAAEPDPEPEPTAYVPDDDDEIDLSELTDAPPEAVKTPVERLAEAFPGSELIPDDRV